MVSIIHWLIMLIPVLLLGLVIWLFVRKRADPAERLPPAGGTARVTHGGARPPGKEQRP